MMLNKELLQGELPTDASSTVSNIIKPVRCFNYPYTVLQEQSRISEAQRKKEREMIAKEVHSAMLTLWIIAIPYITSD